MAHINIEFTLFSAFYSPLIVTMAGGFLKDEGLEHSWRVSPPGVSAVESIVDGSADVIQTAPSQAFNSLKKGETPVAIHFAQVNEMDGFFITGRESDPDFNWKKLEGAEVVMFKSGQPNAMFRYACFKAGIDYDKIIPIMPGGPDAIDATFRAGQGDYAQQQGPYPQQLESDGMGVVVGEAGPLIGPCAFSSLAASQSWLASDEAKAFCRAYTNARNLLNTAPPQEIAELEKDFFPDIELSALTKCIDAYQQLGCWTPHIDITPEALDVTQDVFLYTGTIDRRYQYEEFCIKPPA